MSSCLDRRHDVSPLRGSGLERQSAEGDMPIPAGTTPTHGPSTQQPLLFFCAYILGPGTPARPVPTTGSTYRRYDIAFCFKELYHRRASKPEARVGAAFGHFAELAAGRFQDARVAGGSRLGRLRRIANRDRFISGEAGGGCSGTTPTADLTPIDSTVLQDTSGIDIVRFSAASAWRPASAAVWMASTPTRRKRGLQSFNLSGDRQRILSLLCL